jgi:hypothetical protein
LKRALTLLLCLFSLLGAEEKKVIYLTVPKSGTHMLRKAIEMLTHEKTVWIGIAGSDEFRPGIALKLPPRIIGGHLFHELDQVRTKFGDKYTKILMIRDPRDVMVSFTYHLVNRLQWSGCPTFDYEAFAALPFDEQLQFTIRFPYAYRNPASTFEYALLWMQDPSVYVCRFEDLVGPRGGGSAEKQFAVMRDLATLLNVTISDTDLQTLCDSLYGGTWTFREGQVYNWKTLYSPASKQVFNQELGPYIEAFGYTPW